MPLSSSQIMSLCLIGLGLMVSIAGYVAPFWEYQLVLGDRLPNTEVDVGLIFACYKIVGKGAPDGENINEETCKAMPWNLSIEDDIYFKAVRVLMAGSLYFMLISAIVSISSCCRREKLTSIALEAGFAFLGGIAGIAGVATFAVCTKGGYSPFDQAEVPFELKMGKGWAFYLSCCGCGFMTLISILAACAPKRQAKYISTMETCNGVSGISNPGYGSQGRK